MICLSAACFAAVALSSGASGAGPSLRPVDLRCEYLRNPLGIDVMRPRLTWTVEPTDPGLRALRQTAYQVQAASSGSALLSAKPDLWDSGKVVSAEAAHVQYGGKPLTSRMRVVWRVRCWDQDGRVSAWSAPESWSMGLLSPSDWQARWIGASEGAGRTHPWLRKTFDLTAAPKDATACVASIGYHELYVNGSKVGDGILIPSVSELSKRARYVTYDIAPLLKKGRNVIGLWLASGWGGFGPYGQKVSPLAIARVDIGDGGGPQTIVTDLTWRWRPSDTSAIGGWPAYGGERIDGREALSSWCSPDLDDSSWTAVATHDPKVVLSAEMIEPNRRVRRIAPKGIERTGEDTYRVDMGIGFTGCITARLHGKPGATATILVSERPNDVETYGQRSELVIGPTGEAVFANRFNYVSGRWITIKGVDRAPAPDEVRADLVRTSYGRAITFRCSDAFLNRIFDTTLHTYECLSLGGYTVDCSHRERMGYGGDAHATMETALRSFDVGAFYTKWLQDWRDVQKPDGDLPYTAPTHNGGGGPAWSGICVSLPWEVYRAYGDKRVLADNYPTMQRWLTFLETKAKGDLLERWGGEWDFLGDWVPPGRDQGGNRVDAPSTLFFNNCYWVLNLRTAAEVAAILGKSDDAAKYRQRADTVAKAAHARFFRTDVSRYANGTQLYMALPLLAGVTPQGLRASVAAQLAQSIVEDKQGHVDTGIHGTYYLLQALLGLERNDLVALMAGQRTYPGWGHMLESGATTIWEQWDGIHSLLHSSFLSIGSWFIEGAAGIRPDPSGPGYRRFIVRPGISTGMDWAEAEYQSIRGTIAVRWRKEGGRFALEVRVPPNTVATIHVPTREPAGVTESGKSIAGRAGIRLMGTARGSAVYRLGSGHYRFTSQL